MRNTLKMSGAALFEAARDLGFDGVELDLGAGDPALQPGGGAAVRAASAASGLPVPSVCLGMLNAAGFKHGGAAAAEADDWIRRAIDLCGAVGAATVLVPFFGASELLTESDRAAAARGLRGAAVDAERAGVTLGVESTLSAAEHLALLEQVGSPAVRVYYDVANAMWWGHDGPSEIRRLGGAIVQIHFKDGRASYGDAMLGEGRVDFPAVRQAMADIGYRDWVVLESASPRDVMDDTRANLAFARRLVVGM